MRRRPSRFLRSLLHPGVTNWGEAAWRPPVDVYRSRGGWLVKLELAGVQPRDVEVQVDPPWLIVRGVRRDSTPSRTQKVYSMEIAYNRFERRLELPGDLAGTRITTEYRDGMMLIRLETEVTAP